jgi:hypothetical protein
MPPEGLKCQSFAWFSKRYTPKTALSFMRLPDKPFLPLLLVLFNDMRVGEIEVDGGGGQSVMPEDFLNRCQ